MCMNYEGHRMWLTRDEKGTGKGSVGQFGRRRTLPILPGGFRKDLSHAPSRSWGRK